jgi:hypothetical protein
MQSLNMSEQLRSRWMKLIPLNEGTPCGLLCVQY